VARCTGGVSGKRLLSLWNQELCARHRLSAVVGPNINPGTGFLARVPGSGIPRALSQLGLGDSPGRELVPGFLHAFPSSSRPNKSAGQSTLSEKRGQ
jgi:hypothetical protein